MASSRTVQLITGMLQSLAHEGDEWVRQMVDGVGDEVDVVGKHGKMLLDFLRLRNPMPSGRAECPA